MADYAKTLTSYSGADLQVAFGNRIVGELQSISWAIQRQKSPVYTLGSADARSFSRGVRGIAGSLVFAVFDRDALVDELQQVWEDIAPQPMFTAQANLVQLKRRDFEDAVSQTDFDAAMNSGLETLTQGNQINTEATGSDEVPAGFGVIKKDNIMYADMLPPFDVTLTFANEYGQASFQKIYDVDILNEGSGVSVDSIVMERQMTYIARRMSPIMKGVYTRDGSGAQGTK